MTYQRGLTLVELMVALTLGLVLVGAISAIFVGTRNGYTATTATSGQSDSARFAIDAVSRAIRNTGFIGCNSAPRITSNFANTYGPISDFSDTLSGYEATNTNPGQTYTLSSPIAADSNGSDWTPTLPGSSTVTIYGLLGTAVTNVVQGSDILVVHGTLAQPPAPVTSAVGATISVTVPTGYALLTNLLPLGSIAVVSDCAKGTVFQISSISASAGTGSLTHAGNTSFTFSSSGSVFPLTYNAGAMVYVPTTTFFYIGLGSDGNSALFKSDLTMGSTAGVYSMVANEIASDVDNMQILYGVDPGGTHGATRYVRADQVTGLCSDGTWNCVVSVSVALLMSSGLGAQSVPTSTQSYSLLGTIVNVPSDTRQRSVYQFTVAVRNTLP